MVPQPMGDNDACPAFDQRLHCTHHPTRFGSDVEGPRSARRAERPAVLQDSPSDRQSLPLTSRQRYTALTDTCRNRLAVAR